MVENHAMVNDGLELLVCFFFAVGSDMGGNQVFVNHAMVNEALVNDAMVNEGLELVPGFFALGSDC